MKIVTFGYPSRIGALMNEVQVIDLNLAYAGYTARRENETRPYAKADSCLPSNLAEFIAAGRSAIDVAMEVIDFVVQNRNDVRGPSGEKIIHPLGEVKLTPPLPSLSSRILCLYGNFVKHMAGARRVLFGDAPSEDKVARHLRETPISGFYKLPQCVVGHDEPVHVPQWVKLFDYETELAAYVGKKGKNVTPDEAKEMVVGYSCLFDWSIRDQMLVVGNEQFDPSPLHFAFQKNVVGASLGPCLVVDEISDPYNLNVETKVNGFVRQSFNTGEMVFKFHEIISHITRFIALYPGDIITSGTGQGTGLDSSKPVKEGATRPGQLKVDASLFLKDNDIVEGSIEGIGTLRNPVHFS